MKQILKPSKKIQHLRFLLMIISISLALSSTLVSAKAVSVIDDSGALISLAKPATRILALAPHIVENVYSAGAGDLLVGSVNYANFPPEAESLPQVGGYNKYNIEAIAALKPDVIFAWQSGTPQHFFDKIKQLGIPLYLDEPSTMQEVATAVRNIGVLTGKQDIAEPVVKQYLDELAILRQSQVGKTPLKIFYQVWHDPIYTINGKQIISDVLSLCGGKNIYAGEKIKAPIITIESLIERNPDVIITGTNHQSGVEPLLRWQQWPTMTAVKTNNLFTVNADIVSRHTIRLIQGAQSVCKKFDIARNNLKVRKAK